MTKSKNESKATRMGRIDGSTRALARRHDFDPTGGFNRRGELLETQRAEYVKAYTDAFVAEVNH